MTPQLWIGFGFLAVFILFFMVAFFTKGNISEPQHNILRFLAALCAGFAGGFLSGDAVFKYLQNIGEGGKIAFQGTAGFGLFAFVWMTFPKWTPTAPPLPPDCFSFSIPHGWTFRATVDAIATACRAIAHFEGFTDAELNTLLPPTDLHAPDARQALVNLRYRAGSLPDYTVNDAKGVFHLRASR